MSEANRQVYIDTNIFIQLRDLKDLPWDDVFPVGWIEIVVAPVVIEELDKIKNERDGRKRDRSRAALKLIKQASSQDEMRLELRAASPRLTFRIAHTERINWADYSKLDPTRRDDQLIAAAVTDPAANVCLLSHDTGPIIRARLHGLKAYDAPDEWLLPEVTATDVQEKANLKRELEAARATKPTLELRLTQVTDDGTAVVQIPNLPPLPQHIQTRLIEEILKQHPQDSPRAANFGGIFSSFDFGPSQQEIGKYHSDYADFVEKAEKYFSELHTIIRKTATAFPLKYEIENISQITAMNMIVEFEIHQDVILLADDESAARLTGSIHPPQPPETPRSNWGAHQELLRIDSPSLRHIQASRDPTGFYWQNRPSQNKTQNRGTLICAEFRAGRVWRDSIFVYPYRSPYLGSATISVGATNTRATIEQTTELRQVVLDTTWRDADILERLPAWVSEIINNNLEQ